MMLVKLSLAAARAAARELDMIDSGTAMVSVVRQ